MKLIEQAIFYKDICKFIIFNNEKYFKNNSDHLPKEKYIPKIIHKVWVGNNDQPNIVKKCISSISKISNDGN